MVLVPEGPDEVLEQVKRLVGRVGDLRFMIVHPDQDRVGIEEIFDRKMEDLRSPLPDGRLRHDVEKERFDIALDGTGEEGPLPEGEPGSYILVQNDGMMKMKGDLLTRAFSTVDDFGIPAIGFQWNAEAAREFGDLTGRNLGRGIAIVLDGVIMSRPVIEERVGARGIIRSAFTQDEVNEFVAVLDGGSLPGSPVLESETLTGDGGDVESKE